MPRCRNSIKESNKRKSIGTKSLELNGSRKENEILVFSTKWPFNIDRGILWIDLRGRMGV